MSEQAWTLPQLIGRMLSAGWQPLASGGLQHPDGAKTDLNAKMRDGREYWQQLVERWQLPPTEPIPF